MTPRCCRCRRPLLHPVMTESGAYGVKCAAALFGIKQRMAKREDKRSNDERQFLLALEVMA
jgi:hypothetical protein